MILAEQLSWSTTLALAWTLFGGWLLVIEFTELQKDKNAFPGYRFTKKGRRRQEYLIFLLGVWMFGIAILLLWKA